MAITWKNNGEERQSLLQAIKKSCIVYPYKIFCPSVSIDKDGLFVTTEEYQILK